MFINDIVRCFRNSKQKVYVDDTKIFCVIKSEQDCSNMQSDSDRLESYCARNFLSLNIQKCCIISFTRKTKPFVYDYHINNQKIKSLKEVP